MAVFLIVVGATTLLTLIVLVVGILLRLARLNAAVIRMERELLPGLEELQRLAREAQRTATRVGERASAMAPPEG